MLALPALSVAQPFDAFSVLLAVHETNEREQRRLLFPCRRYGRAQKLITQEWSSAVFSPRV